MDVEYELTADDLYAFQWRAAFSSSLGRRARRASYGGWFVALLLFAIIPAIGRDGFDVSRISLTFLLVAYPIAVLFQWCFERWIIRRAIRHLLSQEKPGRGQLGTHRMVLTEDAIVESTAVGESRTSWAGVDRVEQNDGYIFIYTAPSAAHVIPKRGFQDAEQAERFYQLSHTRWKAAAKGPAGA